MNALLLGQKFALPVYMTLIPIVGGVVIASMKELSITMIALVLFTLSNFSSTAHGILSKRCPLQKDRAWKENWQKS